MENNSTVSCVRAVERARLPVQLSPSDTTFLFEWAWQRALQHISVKTSLASVEIRSGAPIQDPKISVTHQLLGKLHLPTGIPITFA